MKTINKTAVKRVMKIVESNRSVAKRIDELKKAGFTVKEVAMGSGGVGQIKTSKDGEIRLQVGSGKGKYNYAPVVVF